LKPSSNKTLRDAARAAAFAFGCACASVLPAQAQSSAASAPAGPVTYQLDPSHTAVIFEVRHFWTSTLRARLGPIAGQVTIDRGARTGDLRLRIPMATLDSGVPTLDARLKQPDLLATTEYPEAYFIATHFQFDAAGGVKEVRGEFILRGVSEPLSLVARSFACRRDEMLKRDVCGGDFAGDLKRSDFGATFGLPFVADDVHLVVQVEGIAP
jgi:polyisoprenoid-binding protein YceI